MNTVDTEFMASLLNLKKKGDVAFSIIRSSLVYDARNIIAKEALEKDYDRLMMIDSDMVFDEDLFFRLSDDLDTGLSYVAALFFYKQIPTRPVIYKGMLYDDTNERPTVKLDTYLNYPREQVFEIAGSGMGAVMMTTDAIATLVQNGENMPFSPIPGLGEDVSFCLRMNKHGVKMHCDSRIKVDHIGKFAVGEQQYIKQVEAGVKPPM